MKNSSVTMTDVQEFLKNKFGSINNLQEILTGTWSKAYSFETHSFKLILRISQDASDFERDAYAYTFNSPQLPIPKIHEINQFFDKKYAISTYHSGQSINELTADNIHQYKHPILELFNQFRLLDTSKTNGYGLWTREGNGQYASWHEALLDRVQDSQNKRTAGWRKKLMQYDSNFIKIFDQAYRQLAKAQVPNLRHVIHADLLRHNLLVDNGRISAVIDWGCGQYGDFLYDLAWFCFWKDYYPVLQSWNLQQEACIYFEEQGADLTNFKYRMYVYELHIALDTIIFNTYIENWALVKKTIKSLQANNLPLS